MTDDIDSCNLRDSQLEIHKSRWGIGIFRPLGRRSDSMRVRADVSDAPTWQAGHRLYRLSRDPYAAPRTSLLSCLADPH
jgi:hypothetical protein